MRTILVGARDVQTKDKKHKVNLGDNTTREQTTVRTPEKRKSQRINHMREHTSEQEKNTEP
jgi:hypothetical protein